MNTDDIVQQIIKLENSLLFRKDSGVTLAPMNTLSETCVKMTILLANLSEPLFQAELDYKLARAARYDAHLKMGLKPTQADRELKFDQEMIAKEMEVDRLNGFIKRVDLLVSAVKAHIGVKTAEARNTI